MSAPAAGTPHPIAGRPATRALSLVCPSGGRGSTSRRAAGPLALLVLGVGIALGIESPAQAPATAPSDEPPAQAPATAPSDEPPAQAPASAPSDEPPPLSSADLDLSAPAVRIVDRQNHQIEEYRVGNNVYMVKVNPRNAPPYYLIDEDGSGALQWRRDMNPERLSVPRWAIIRW